MRLRILTLGLFLGACAGGDEGNECRDFDCPSPTMPNPGTSSDSDPGEGESGEDDHGKPTSGASPVCTTDDTTCLGDQAIRYCDEESQQLLTIDCRGVCGPDRESLGCGPGDDGDVCYCGPPGPGETTGGETTGGESTGGVEEGEETTGETTDDSPCCEPGGAPPCFEGAECCADGQWSCYDFGHLSTCEAPGNVCVVMCGDDVCAFDESCIVVGEDPQCLGFCDPLDLSTCADDEMCAPQMDMFVCVPDASGSGGKVGDGCEYANACDAGNVCLNAEYVAGCQDEACCSMWCNLDLPDPCQVYGMLCVPWYEMGTAPPGFETLGLCTLG